MRNLAVPSFNNARLVIFGALFRARLKNARANWKRAEPWLSGVAFVLAYLFAAAKLEAADLRAELRIANAANIEIDSANADLEDQLREARAAQGQKLFYLIEADDSRQAREKLARASLLVASEHFKLQEAAK